MRNKNIWIGIALVAAIAVVAVLSAVLPARVAPPAADAPTLGPDVFAESTATADPTTEPTATARPTAQATATADPTTEPTATAEPTAQATATAKPTTEPTATASPTAEPDATEEAAATEAPDAAEETAPVTVTSPSGETTTPAPEESEEPEVTVTFDPASIKAWLVVTAGGTVYQPIPLVEEGEYSVIQEETGAKNVIHVTTESIDMKSSTCENQDCVKQGVVSLDNMDSRLLGNMIICLPNQVTLELYTTEELIQLLSGT